MEVLLGISKREGFNLPRPLAQSICNFSKRNLRRAIMMLQTAKLKNENLSDKTYVPAPEYETYTRDIAKMVISEQSPKQLRAIRSKLYELLVKGITADMIFGILSREFLRKPSPGDAKNQSASLPEPIKPEVLKFAVMFEHRCKEGSKAIFHLEAFLARVMALYKGYMIKTGLAR
jgi:replication factor C subunit 3/5